MDLRWPASREALARLQSERRRIAVERALRSPFHARRLGRVDLDRLDDPVVWNRIPILTKDELRGIPPSEFHAAFCIQPRSAVVEYWRSGGTTGRPLFYPRTAEDMTHSLVTFQRAYALIGATADDLVHLSFPLGIHPVGSLYARAAEAMGLGTVWCGAGANTPSELQLELIDELRPTVWTGMASYGLHLANLAEARGFDLARSSVRKLIVAAEPLSPMKRAKLERMWGAEVFDHFGMTEGAFVAGESASHDGLHVFSDLFYCEVVDEAAGTPVPEGEVGSLVVTPLWNNTMTPFLRWSSGDLVTMRSSGSGNSPWSIFPILQHSRRTVGFFKVRGINVNHAEFEDLMFGDPQITDFRVEIGATDGGLDELRLIAELARGVDAVPAAERIAALVRQRFQVTPVVEIQPAGTIARAFEANVKAPRFIDRRG
jgi:phenylacetate-CoA ligase